MNIVAFDVCFDRLTKQTKKKNLHKHMFQNLHK